MSHRDSRDTFAQAHTATCRRSRIFGEPLQTIDVAKIAHPVTRSVEPRGCDVSASPRRTRGASKVLHTAHIDAVNRPSEPPRDVRRLHTLGSWSHAREHIEEVPA